MAEAQLNMNEEIETLTISDILVMTVDELRNELYKRDKLPEGIANKPSYRWLCLTQFRFRSLRKRLVLLPRIL